MKPQSLKKLLETDQFAAVGEGLTAQCDGIIAPIPEFEDRIAHHVEADLIRIARLTGASDHALSAPDFALPRAVKILALDAMNGSADVEHASAVLRVMEAQQGREDRDIKLMAYLFPSLSTLADDPRAFQKSERLHALALDEERLAQSVSATRDEHALSAPLIYARARIIAIGRSCDVPVYIKPLYRAQDPHARILDDAARDGFDGIIGPKERLQLAP